MVLEMVFTDSDQYSFRSGALTRTTSTDGYSEQVITPLDEMPPIRPNAGVTKMKSNMQDGQRHTTDAVRVYTGSLQSPNGNAMDHDIHLSRDSEVLAAEDMSYFPFNHHQNVEDVPMRRRLTRELISRYEGMNQSSPSATSPYSISKDRRDDPLPDIPPPLSEMKNKNRAPIRESFRNLFSVFGKNKKNKNDVSIPSTRYQSSEEMSRALGSEDKNFHVGTPPRASSPNALKSGPLLYLCASPTAETLPVWNYCIAKLLPAQLILEWSTSFGNPVTHSIPLISCTDVHSLPAAQVSYTERKLLPDQADTYIFKLTFHDSTSETFSANSVSERSAWVSAIWDALLHCHNKYEKKDDFTEANDGSTQIANTQILVSDNKQNNQENLDRRSLDLDHRPVSASNPPLRRTSLADQSKSPSIIKLDDMSVVRSRIAQINVNGFDTPLSRSTSRSRTTKYLAPPVLEHRGTAKRPLGVQRSNTSSVRRITDSGDEFSVLEMYHDQTSNRQSFLSECRATGNSRVVNKEYPSSYNDQAHSEWTPQPSQYATTPATTTYTQFQSNESAMHPLVALIEDHAARQYENTADIGRQIKFLRENMHTVAHNLRLLTSNENNMSTKQLLNTLYDKFKDMVTLQEFSKIDEKLSALQTTTLNNENPKSNVVERFNEVELNNGTADRSSHLFEKLEEILSFLKKHVLEEGNGSAIQVMSNISSKHDADDKQSYENGQENGKSALCNTHNDKLEEIVGLCQKAEEQRVAQAQQQEDSVRYLHELNAWLESFVNNGTNQMQAASSALQELCKSLGFAGDAKIPGDNVMMDVASDNSQRTNLLSDVRKLVEESQTHGEQMKSMEAILKDSLSPAGLNALQNIGTATNQTSVVDAVTTLMDHQRQEQEKMLKSIAIDLSNDIKGERLRFVEAMKEATAINVQLHVEEFKKELSKEVMSMTHDVGRLHKERQVLQQQIGELFSFITKQREELARSTAANQQPSGYKDPRGPHSADVRKRPLPTPILPGNFNAHANTGKA